LDPCRGWTRVTRKECKAYEVLPAEESSLDPEQRDLPGPNVQHHHSPVWSTIGYSYLILATGLKTDFESIKGLPEALQSVPGVCSNYSPVYVNKTREAIQNFPTSGGNALFTFPNTPIKCPGAPQKIAYLAEAAFRRAGIRDKVNITFNSSLGVIFGVKKYADALWKYVVNERDINVNFKHNLVEVKPESKEAVFELLDEPGKYATFPFDMLHVVPPMTTPQFLKDAKDLTNAAGFVNVNQENLQHVKYSNIFALGDCSSLPTSKTAAAIASQAGVLLQTMDAVMKGKKPTEIYDGYTSCPLVTGNGKCILAEFDYQVQPLETFPINQGKERMTMFQLKKDAMPFIYWNLMLKGFWNGPKTFRKILHLGMSK